MGKSIPSAQVPLVAINFLKYHLRMRMLRISRELYRQQTHHVGRFNKFIFPRETLIIQRYCNIHLLFTHTFNVQSKILQILKHQRDGGTIFCRFFSVLYSNVSTENSPQGYYDLEWSYIEPRRFNSYVKLFGIQNRFQVLLKYKRLYPILCTTVAFLRVYIVVVEHIYSLNREFAT